MTCSTAEVCLRLQRLDKEDADVKMTVIQHCKLCSHFLAGINFGSMLSHNTWQLASRQGNTLATEIKDSIYGPVPTQKNAVHEHEKRAAGMDILDWGHHIVAILIDFK